MDEVSRRHENVRAALRRDGMRTHRRFVALVEAHLARVQRIERVLQLVELTLRHLGALPGVGQRTGQPVDLVCGGTGGGPQRLDLPSQPGQSLPPVRDGADGGQVRPLGIGDRLLQLHAPIQRGR